MKQSTFFAEDLILFPYQIVKIFHILVIFLGLLLLFVERLYFDIFMRDDCMIAGAGQFS